MLKPLRFYSLSCHKPQFFIKTILSQWLELPRPEGTPSLRERMSYIDNFQRFTFLLLKRRWIQKLVFEDGGVQNISSIKIYRTLINHFMKNRLQRFVKSPELHKFVSSWKQDRHIDLLYRQITTLATIAEQNCTNKRNYTPVETVPIRVQALTWCVGLW